MSVNSGFFMPPVSHLRNHLATPAEITLTHYRICMVVAARGEPPTEETFPHSTNLAAAKSPLRQQLDCLSLQPRLIRGAKDSASGQEVHREGSSRKLTAGRNSGF